MTTPIFKGDRVRIAAHTDCFMMGERFGEVVKKGRLYFHVKGERSGRVFRFLIIGDSIETTAPRVTVNEERELYVIRHPDAVSCLGFDVCADRAGRYLDWLAARDPESGAAGLRAAFDRLPRGALGRFDIYEEATRRIKERFDRTRERCDAELTPQLVGLEGKRVEVVDSYGETRRFRVGRSTGWIPVHLELEPNASGGAPVYGAPFKRVSVL